MLIETQEKPMKDSIDNIQFLKSFVPMTAPTCNLVMDPEKKKVYFYY